MRVLVIGGTRFIGPHVVRGLVELGHEVTVFHRGDNELALDPAVRHVHSPSAAMPVTTFPRELTHPSPDMVIHMIPMGENDTRAAVELFRGISQRLVCVSSGDVYRAYGVFVGIEPGAPEPGLLTEDSPLRTMLYPYRAKASSNTAREYYYEKILVERVAMSEPQLPGTILRLPKVYGSGENADLATVYGFSGHRQWRWTHGYVENVADAIVLAAVDARAAGRIYNVGEEYTPTVAERLSQLPPRPPESLPDFPGYFAQDIAYDTTRIRRELGYRERVSYPDGLRRTLGPAASIPA